jgi:hypothetical protein
MNFDPYNWLLKIWESIWTPILKVGVHLGVWGVHSLTLSYTLGSMKCDSHASLLAAPLQAFTLVASPRLRLQ